MKSQYRARKQLRTNDTLLTDLNTEETVSINGLQQIHKTFFHHLSGDGFSFNILEGNPLVEGGCQMHQELQPINFTACDNHQDTQICQPLQKDTAVQNEPSLEEEHDPLYIGPEPGMGTTGISHLQDRLNFGPEVGTPVKVETVDRLNNQEEGTTVKSETEEVLDSETCVWVTVKSETEDGLDPDSTAP